MSKFGANHLQWAQFAAVSADESPEAFPKYQAPKNLGPLVMVSDTVTSDDVEDHGDDGVQDALSIFQKLEVQAEVTELPFDVYAPMYGMQAEPGGDLLYTTNDNPPWGCLGFYIRRRVAGETKFQGIFYPKVKAVSEGDTYNTKGKTITLAHDHIRFLGAAALNGCYRKRSKLMDSETEAKAWVDNLVKAAM